MTRRNASPPSIHTEPASTTRRTGGIGRWLDRAANYALVILLVAIIAANVIGGRA